MALLLALRFRENGFGGGLNSLADGLSGSLLNLSGLGSDGGVKLGVNFFHVLDHGGNKTLLLLREFFLEVSGLLFIMKVVVGLNVTTKYV